MVDSSPRKQQSTEGPSTPNSGRGVNTEQETTIHSLPATIRTLPSTVGIPSQGVRQTNRHLYDNWVPTTTAYKWWNCQVPRPANCCQHILPNRFLDGFPDPSQFAAAKLTHYSSKPQRPSAPRDHGNASCSQEMYTRTLALLQSIHVRCVLAMLQVVGSAIYAIVALDGYIRSVLVFKTQQSIDELRTGFAALAIPHPLYRNYNRHQFQHKLSMRIHSPSCNSTQMASATN